MKKLILNRDLPEWFKEYWNFNCIPDTVVLKKGYKTWITNEKDIYKNQDSHDIGDDNNVEFSKEQQLDLVIIEDNRFVTNFPLEWFNIKEE